MKFYIYLFSWTFLLLTLASCTSVPSSQSKNSEQEEWISLFNGKDLTGWDIKISGYELNENYKNTFVVEDSMLRISYAEYDTFGNAYGHLYYEKPYSYYVIRFDYRFVGEQVPGGESWNVRNSGVMLHSESAESVDFDQDFPVSIEVQLLGGLSDGKPRTTGNVCTPGTAVVLKDSVDYTHCINSNSKTYDGDQWVSMEVIVLGDSLISHIIEGDTILQYTKPQITGYFINESNPEQDWAAFGITDWQEWAAKGGQLLKEGYIALQAESHAIDFRNIELLNLEGCTDPKAVNYKSYFVKSNNSTCVYE